jgi:riboflavin biosynthesis pyrimidine reductase
VAKLVDWLAAIYSYPDQHWVRANMVASVDGAITVDGRSAGLSGAADRLVFSILRSLADVIVVGAGTARAERYGRAKAAHIWPQLRAGRPAAPPLAVVTRSLDLGSRLMSDQEGGDLIALTTRRAPAERREAVGGVAQLLEAGEQDVDAAAAVEALAGCGHRRILVEGGPVLLGQLASAGALDELCVTISPILVGGRSARITAGLDPLLTELALAAVLEDEGYLLCRYLRAG